MSVGIFLYPDPKVKNAGIPKGIIIDSTDVSFKVEDAYFEGKEKKSYPIEAEPEPAFSAPPKQIEEKKTTANTVVGHKIEARVEDGNKTILKGLGIATLALGMAALTVVTGGAALAVAGALMEGGLISTAIGAGVATIAGVGMGMGLEGAGMEANVAEATVEEGNNEINNGNQGIDENGYNRIRDGEFGGDEEAYQKYQDQAIGLWETGVMINMTAATVGTEALPVAGVADAMYGDKISSTFSKVFQYREEELVCSSNPLLETEGENTETNLVENDLSKERAKYFEDLKSGVIDDVAWTKLNKYANKEGIDLNSISWDEKMSKIDKFKSDLMADLDSMKYIEDNANELLRLSDVRLRDCVENGYKAEDYYKILNQDKVVRNPEEYLKSLENTKLVGNWNEEFYGNDSKVAISYMPKDAYDNFVLKYGTIGRPGENGGQFVLPQKIGDSIEEKLTDLGSISDSTPEFKMQLAKELGLPEDVFANGVVRVEIPLDGDINLHIVTGVEDGCNYQWVPGGKTLGGTTEGIIRQITRDNDSGLYDKITSNVKR